jgi:hypothetical protein
MISDTHYVSHALRLLIRHEQVASAAIHLAAPCGQRMPVPGPGAFTPVNP